MVLLLRLTDRLRLLDLLADLVIRLFLMKCRGHAHTPIVHSILHLVVLVHTPVELYLPIHNLGVGTYHSVCLLLQGLGLALVLEVLPVGQLAFVHDLDCLHLLLKLRLSLLLRLLDSLWQMVDTL